MIEFIKRLLSDDRIYLSLLMITIAVAAFGLGRLSERDSYESKSTPRPEVVVHELAAEVESDQPVVVSKNGTKYHLPWCPGAEQMNEENKVVYESIAAAEAAGYTPAANCKGL